MVDERVPVVLVVAVDQVVAQPLGVVRRIGQGPGDEGRELADLAAGVADLIEFSVCDFADTPVPQGEAGVMMVNPEYGERLGEVTELEATYARIGDFMKQKCKGYHGYIFTGNMELAKKIGLKTKRRIEFYNSKIDCRLMEYELYEGTRKAPKEETPEA